MATPADVEARARIGDFGRTNDDLEMRGSVEYLKRLREKDPGAAEALAKRTTFTSTPSTGGRARMNTPAAPSQDLTKSPDIWGKVKEAGLGLGDLIRYGYTPEQIDTMRFERKLPDGTPIEGLPSQADEAAQIRFLSNYLGSKKWGTGPAEVANQLALDDKPWASGITGVNRSPEEAARIRIAGRAGQTASGASTMNLPPVTAGQIGNRLFTAAVKASRR